MVETRSTKEDEGPLNYNYYSLLFTLGAARVDFVAPLLDQNRSKDNNSFKKFTSWVKVQSESRSTAIDNLQEQTSTTDLESGDSPAFSVAACHFFDLIVGTEATVQKKDIPTAFDAQTALFLTGMRKRMVGQSYKWVCWLSPYNSNGSFFDFRPMELWNDFSAVCGTSFKALGNLYYKAPVVLRTLLQEQFFPKRMVLKEIPEIAGCTTPTSLEVSIYVWLLIRGTVLRKGPFSKETTTQAGKRKATEMGTAGKLRFARLCYAVQIIVKGWSVFFRALRFDNIDDLLYVFLQYDKDTQLLSVRESPYMTAPVSRNSFSDQQTVSVGDKTAILPFQYMTENDLEQLRSFMRDFLNDLETVTLNDAIYTCPLEDFSQSLELVPFQVTGTEQYPPRFSYNEDVISRVRSNINIIRVGQSASGVISPPRVNPATGLTPTPPPTVGHICPEGCDCTVIKGVLFREMEKVCTIIHTPQKYFLEQLEELPAHSSTEGEVQLILTDPPYECRRELNKKNSSHDVLSYIDMQETADTCAKLLRPGGHVVLFCAPDQFKNWSTAFSNCREEDDEEKKAFLLSKTPMLFIPQVGQYRQVLNHRKLTLANISEQALHVVRRVSRRHYKAAFDMVSWTGQGYIPSSFPAHTNVMNNVPALSVGERFYRTDSKGASSSKGNRPQMLRPEQKSVLLLKELIARFSNPGDIVVDLFGGTFSTAIAALTLPDMRIFVGGDSDAACTLHAQMRCLSAFAKVVTRLDSDTTRDSIAQTEVSLTEELRSAANKYLDRYSSSSQPIPGWSKDPLWNAPEGFPSAQRLPLSSMKFLATMLQDKCFLDPLLTNSSPDSWPTPLRCKFQDCGTDMLRALEAVQFSVACSEDLRQVYTNRLLTPDVAIGYVHGTLVYRDLSRERSKSNTYGRGHHSVTSVDFKDRSIPILTSDSVVKGESTSQSACFLVPGSFNVFYYVQFSNVPAECNAYLQIKTAAVMEPKDIIQSDLVTIRSSKTIQPNSAITVLKTPKYIPIP